MKNLHIYILIGILCGGITAVIMKIFERTMNVYDSFPSGIIVGIVVGLIVGLIGGIITAKRNKK